MLPRVNLPKWIRDISRSGNPRRRIRPDRGNWRHREAGHLCLAGKPCFHNPVNLAGKPCRETSPGDLAGRRCRETSPGNLAGKPRQETNRRASVHRSGNQVPPQTGRPASRACASSGRQPRVSTRQETRCDHRPVNPVSPLGRKAGASTDRETRFLHSAGNQVPPLTEKPPSLALAPPTTRRPRSCSRLRRPGGLARAHEVG